MSDGYRICSPAGCITVRPSKRRSSRRNLKRPTTSGGKRMSLGGGQRSKEPRLCLVLRRQVAAGRTTSIEAINQVSKKTGKGWAQYCRDPKYKKLSRAIGAGRSKRSRTPLLDAALRRREKALQAAKAAKIGQIKTLMKTNPSKAWSIVEGAAKKAFDLLEAARKTQQTETSLKVWTSRAAAKIQKAVGEAKKWSGLADTAVAAYQAFDLLRRVKPEWAKTQPKYYALAMGGVLAAAGKAMKGLPAPFNVYGDWLVKSGRFFENVRHGLDPSVRWQKRFDRIRREGGR